MVLEEERYNNGGGSTTTSNGFPNGGSSSGSDGGSGSGSGLMTYKRRRTSTSWQLVEKYVSSHQSGGEGDNNNNKVVKELVDIGFEKSSFEQETNRQSLPNGSDDNSNHRWRNALEDSSHSLKANENGFVNGGLHGCSQEAGLDDIPRTRDASVTKKDVEHLDDQSHELSTSMANGAARPNGTANSAKVFSIAACNGSSSDSNHSSISRSCERALKNLITSGKYQSLCKLLSESFHGLKIEKILNIGLIDTRIKEGIYEHKPLQFSSDIQQIWRRLSSVGNEMASLANNLAEMSRNFCHELGGDAEPDSLRERNHELPSQDCSMRFKSAEPGASMFCTCRNCGENSDERDCLVCDSCEDLYHVTCIQPPVEEIPHRSWYCAKCTASGIESPHEDCVVCERLKSNSVANGGVDGVLMDGEALDELDEENSDGLVETGVQVFKGSKRLPCKVCTCVLNKGEEFRVCEHRFCQYKYYHTRCLSNKQLNSYGPRWYCPSCLCRVCLMDKDDDDIVMCDGCDHGYHIYCMNPPLASIPKGKWFCQKCDAGIQAICTAKRLFEEALETKSKGNNGKLAREESLNKSRLDFEEPVRGSGGMDMLLTAAKTLNEEELSAVV